MRVPVLAKCSVNILQGFPGSSVYFAYHSILCGHEATERDTEGDGHDMSMPLKLFLASESVFRDVHTDYNLDLRFLVKKQISMIKAGLSWRHMNI